MAYLYILYSPSLDKYYVGHTTVLPQERLRRHLTHHDGFTAKGKDWVLVYEEAFEDKSAAYAREREIKNWKSRKRMEALIGKG